MSETPNLDAMRARTRGLEEAATPGPWRVGWAFTVKGESRWHLGESAITQVLANGSGGEQVAGHDAYNGGGIDRREDAALIAAFRTDAPRYEAMLGVLLEEVAAPCDCNWLAGYHDLPACHIRAALAKIEEMARE